MKRMFFIDGGHPPYINIKETSYAYVSSYSEFLMSHIPQLKNCVVCDYGAGTGILGITAFSMGASKIYGIEINRDSLQLAKDNIANNAELAKFDLLNSSKNNCINDVSFDYIFCNPASLPDIVGSDSFYNGGKLGIDMIKEVIEFSSTNLKNDGHLYILITNILPVSPVFNLISEKGLNCRIVDSMLLPFRVHYKNIKSWVDNLQPTYPEMRYLIRNNVLYEEVVLYDIQKRGV